MHVTEKRMIIIWNYNSLYFVKINSASNTECGRMFLIYKLQSK